MEGNVAKVSSELGLERKYLQSVTLDANGYASIAALVEDSWLFQLKTNGKITTSKSALAFSSVEYIPPLGKAKYPWRHVVINVVSKDAWKSHGIDQYSSEKLQSSAVTELNFMSTMASISQHNFTSLWKTTQNSYQTLQHADRSKTDSQDSTTSLKVLIERLYGCKVVCLVKETSAEVKTNTPPVHRQLQPFSSHANLLPVFCAIESKTSFYIIQPYQEHSLHHAVTFSPAMLANSHAKPLFLIYQILQVMLHCHKQGLSLGEVNLKDFSLDGKLWLQVTGPNLNQVKEADIQTTDNHQEEKDWKCELKDLPGIVQQWVQGELSNFDYLMVLNNLTGRVPGNPNHHPILPWVTDFNSPTSNYRDLTKSKCRLNKGEDQLDITFEAAVDGHTVPHHFTDLLSDITYHVYFARRTPKSVLCTHVRSAWVPNEYPWSIQRIQEWTPEECVPEFYTDPIVFQSIHSDLPDLEVPPWCNSVEDFLTQHRAVLESEPVSKQLHHWIDLTFGYKLSGSAAVKAKNVCLQLVDQHTKPTTHGVLQLFDKPHPIKITTSKFTAKEAPQISRVNSNVSAPSSQAPKAETCGPTSSEESQSRDNENDDVIDSALPVWQDDIDNLETQTEEEIAVSASNKLEVASNDVYVPDDTDFVSQKNPIKRLSVPFFSKPRGDTVLDNAAALVRSQGHDMALPDKYDPLQQLNQLEMLYEFCSTNMKILPKQPDKQRHKEDVCECLVAKDMYIMGCLIAEMLIADKLRMQNPQASLWERYQVVHKVCQANLHLLPRPIRYALTDILQLDRPPDESFSYPMTSDEEKLPPPTPSQLLNPYTSVFPFPRYFPSLYDFLSKLHQLSADLPKDEAAMETTQLALQYIPKLLSRMSQEGKELLLPHIVALFEDYNTAPFTTLYLFSKVSKHLGPAMTITNILPAMKKLYEADQYATPVCLLLYHKSFLSQLLTRIGLKALLVHILDFLVEAAAGRKMCPVFDGMEKEEEKVGSLSRCVSIGEDALKAFGDDDDDNDADDDDEEDDETVALEIDDEDSDSRSGEIGSGRQSDSSLDHSYSKDDDDSSSAGKTSLSKDDDTNSTEGVTILIERGDEEDDRPWEDENLMNRSDEQDGTSTDSTGQDVVKEDDYNDSNDKDNGTSDEIRMMKVTDSDEVDKISIETNNGDSSTEKNKKMDAESSNSFDRKTGMVAMEKHGSDLVSGMCLADVAVDSICWLSQKLGPLLTAKYLSKQLLRALSLCYMEAGQLMFVKDKPDASHMYNSAEVVGDSATVPVLQCLADIAVRYGQPFILDQYIPFIKQVVLSGHTRVNTKVEAGLIASMVLLKYMLVYLSDAVLMRSLKSFFQNILHPLISILSSKYIGFPGGGHARAVLCHKMVDVITMITFRIGREMAREHMTTLLQQFFGCFDVIHGSDKDPPQSESPSNKAARQIQKAEVERQASFVGSFDSDSSMYCEIRMDSSTNTYTIGTPTRLKDMKGDEDQLNHFKRGDMFEGLELGTPSEAVLEELKYVFTPEMAYTIYIPLCRLVGSIHMEKVLLNHELIWKLSSSYEVALAAQTVESEIHVWSNGEENNTLEDHQVGRQTFWFIDTEPSAASASEDIVSGQFGSNVAMVGNRIDIAMQQEQQEQQSKPQIQPKFEETLKTMSDKLGKSERTLQGNWLSCWEHSLGLSNQSTSFDIHQIKLTTYPGHTNSVRSLCILDNETSFMSGSKDKTVKLWSLHNHGDGTSRIACQWTYGLHKKSVFSVNFIESMRLCASCDNNIHIWDPFTGNCVLQFTMSRSQASVLTTMPAPSPLLLAATTDNCLRVLDARVGKLQQELKVTSGPSGLIRCLAVSSSGNVVAVGFTSGILSLVDIRTGLLLGGWKAHDGEILQVKGYDNRQFVTSSIDHHLTVWGEDGSEKAMLRGINEPVHCINTYQNLLLSATNSNKLAIHSILDGQMSYCNKLHSEVFKGILTTFDVLPMNKLLLLGSDNGNIYLMA
ncbi:WD repeat-containing protein 81-like [Glandiceps talaboti]